MFHDEEVRTVEGSETKKAESDRKVMDLEMGKVYSKSQTLECFSIGQYWNI